MSFLLLFFLFSLFLSVSQLLFFFWLLFGFNFFLRFRSYFLLVFSKIKHKTFILFYLSTSATLSFFDDLLPRTAFNLQDFFLLVSISLFGLLQLSCYLPFLNDRHPSIIFLICQFLRLQECCVRFRWVKSLYLWKLKFLSWIRFYCWLRWKINLWLRNNFCQNIESFGLFPRWVELNIPLPFFGFRVWLLNLRLFTF